MHNAVAEHARSVFSVAAQGLRSGQAQDLITRSWIRCLNEYGLDPGAQVEPLVVAPADLRARRERLAELVQCAKLEMANLFQQLADAQTLVVLTDADGVVLSLVGDPAFTREAGRGGLREGAVWSERTQGTNGMGTCLAEESPVVIHRDQHFLARNTGMSCTAAPIFDCQGRLAAVLDISSRSALPQQYAMALVNMAAQMIENQALLACHRAHHILRFHSRPEFVYTLHEGQLALTEQGRVLAANRSALLQLGVKRFADLCDADIERLFDTSLGDLIGRSARGSFHPVPLYGARQGSRYFAVAQQPEPQRPQVVVARAETASAPVEADPFARLAHGDPVMAYNIHRVRRVLDRDVPVLLSGETGTGKEVFARAIHAASRRAGGPFVAVDCASLPETLIESELFGYRAGAFTGANREGRRGKIAQANGGTLFLDEIGDMPLNLQARLLRVLEERMVVPLGGEAPIVVEFQLVSATHRDLPAMVKRGEFREDLYYRLQGLALQLVPLRERADRRAVIEHTARAEAGDGVEVRIDARALALLEAYPWPGNIRQLRSTLRVAAALCEHGVIAVRDLPVEIQQVAAAPDADGAEDEEPLNSLESAEREALIRELERHRWNISSLAQQLETSRNTIYRKMKRLNIHHAQQRPA